MKKVILSTVLMVFGLALFPGYASTQSWPDHPSTRMKEPTIRDRIAELHRRIDQGKIHGRYPESEGQVLQWRLDAIRTDYSRMREGGRYPTYEERRDISHRLDLLEKDLNRPER